MTSTAVVITPKAARYAKQLIAHLGHKLDFDTDGDTSTTTIGAGTGQVVIADDGRAVALVALGDDTDTLATIEHVLGSHFERFAQRDGLTASWTRGSTEH